VVALKGSRLSELRVGKGNGQALVLGVKTLLGPNGIVGKTLIADPRRRPKEMVELLKSEEGGQDNAKRGEELTSLRRTLTSFTPSMAGNEAVSRAKKEESRHKAFVLKQEGGA